jgi:hypothetical protein
VPPSDSFGAGLLYTCDVETAAFPIELLETPRSSSLNPDPTLALLQWPVPTAVKAWWLTARTETRAEFLGPVAERENPLPAIDSLDWFLNFGEMYEYAILERDTGGDWKAGQWGGCQFDAVVPGPEGSQVLEWWIREQDSPRPGDLTLQIGVHTWCPQTLQKRILKPIVRYASERILAIVAARPVGQERSSCGLDEIANVTIELDEEVGDRLILDGNRWPGRDARVRFFSPLE